MGCGCSTPKQAINTPDQDKVTPETFGNKLAPERVQMEDDASSTKLIDGEYTKVAGDYSRADTPEPAQQAGVGTWGSGDRFSPTDNGVPGAKYNLPEVTGTDPCNAAFGKMTADRFQILDNGVPGAKYNLPEVTGTDPACAFGNMTADRFQILDNGVPGCKYDLPEVTGTDPTNAVFGKMTADRFIDLQNTVPGPGAYAAPKRFPDKPWQEPCFAVFGAETSERMHIVEDVTQDTFAKYDVEKSAKAQSKALKVPTSSFGRKTSKRFRKPKKEIGPIYNVAGPKWGGGKAAGGSWGKTTSSRFRIRRNSLGGPGGYNPGSTFGGKSKFSAR